MLARTPLLRATMARWIRAAMYTSGTNQFSWNQELPAFWLAGSAGVRFKARLARWRLASEASRVPLSGASLGASVSQPSFQNRLQRCYCYLQSDHCAAEGTGVGFSLLLVHVEQHRHPAQATRRGPDRSAAS